MLDRHAHLARRIRLSAAMLPLLSATPAAAAAGAPGAAPIVVTGSQGGSGYVPVVTGIAKIAAPLRDIPQSIAVVGRDLIRDQRALSMQDALKNVPGVGLGSGDGQRDQVFIRGFSAIADQYVDGFRDDGLYFRDLSNVDRIEVVKGPAAVLYGRGSSGGLVNRVTKKPDTDILSAAFTGGSFDTKRGEFDIGRVDRSSGVGVRLTGAYENDDSFRAQNFIDRKAIAPGLLLGQGSDTTLLVQADYLTDRRLTDFGIPSIDGRPVDVPRSTYYGAANARDADVTHSTVFSQTAVFTSRLSDSLSLRNGFRHYRYLLDRHSTNATAVDPEARTVTLTHGGIQRDEDGWSNQAELTQKLGVIGTRHTLLYGWEQSCQSKQAITLVSRAVAITPILSPVLPTVDDVAYGTAADDNVNRFRTIGFYVQDLADLGHGVKLLAGVRHDRFRQTTTQLIAGQPNLARTDRTWSPRAGIVLQPNATQSYYASWSRSFQPSGETFALVRSNAALAPERTVNKEIGAKYNLLEDHLAIQLAAFVLRRTNIKGTDPLTQLVVPIGTQRTRGIELSAQLDLPDGFRATAGYSYLSTRVTASATPSFVGKRATVTPKNAVNAFLTKTIATHYGLGTGMNYVGDRWADPANTTVLSHYVTADVMGWADVGELRLQINVYNIANRRYIVAGHGTSPLLNQPGAPRSVLGTVRVTI